MTVNEILKKRNYYELSNTLNFNPDSVDNETARKVRAIQAMFKNQDQLQYKHSAMLVLKLYLENDYTLQQIADKLFISTRHVDRLKRQAIVLISRILEHAP